jgi:phosphate-selective porin OprO/OprP
MPLRILFPAALVAILATGGPVLAQTITASLRGTVQFDAVAVADGTLPPGETIATGGNFRRIRLNLGGRIGDNWAYEFGPRLEASSIYFIAIGNAYVQYDGWGPLHLRVGAFAPPTNFEDATSSGETLFLERAQPADLSRSVVGSPGRSAATLFAHDERYFAALSYTGGTINDAIDRQQAVVGRFAWRPWIDGGNGLAVGMNVSHLFAPPRTGATHDLRLRQRPELNTKVVDLRLVDTGNLDSNSLTTIGLEAAGNIGSFYAQGGVFHMALDRAPAAIDDPSFGGWYLQGSWILTGDTRVWRDNRGGYGAPEPASVFPENGFGAWEIALRYSHSDLDHHAGLAGMLALPGAIRGGRQNITTLGLNWYPTDALRLMLNYQHVTVDRLNGAGGDIGARMNLLTLRTQFSL